MYFVLLVLLGAGAYGIGSTPIHRAVGLSDIDDPKVENCRCRSLARVLLNMLKGLIVVEIGSLLGDEGALVALYFVCLGHNYPIWTSFRGGTGLGTVLGASIALDPTLGLVCLGAWTFAYYSFLNRTVAALFSAIATPVVAGGLPLSLSPLLLVPVSVLVIWRHRRRLMDLHMPGPKETEDHFRKL